MSYSGDAADQVVRMSLNGVEVAAKLTGAAAKQIAIMLYAVLKDQKKTKGKIRLTNMLRSGKELKVFAVKDEDLTKFCTEAKKYGVLYCVLKDKNANDGITDIMVRAEDASKINRIFERFKLTTVDMADVKTEITRTKAKQDDIPEPERGSAEKSPEEQFVDQLMAKPNPTREEAQQQNPTSGSTTKSRPSEPTSGKHRDSAGGDSDERSPQARPSVRKELEDIRREQRQNAAQKPLDRGPQQSQPHQHPHKKKKGKVK